MAKQQVPHTLELVRGGVVLGAFVQGFKVEGRHFVGTSFDFATPFALLTGVALMFGYALLGSGWLVMKTEGELQAWSRRAGRICLVGVAVAVVAVSVWTPFVDPGIAQRWFSWPNILWLSPVPVVTAGITALCWLSLGGRSEALQTYENGITGFEALRSQPYTRLLERLAEKVRRHGVPIEPGVLLPPIVRKGRVCTEIRGVGEGNDARRCRAFDARNSTESIDRAVDVGIDRAAVLVNPGRQVYLGTDSLANIKAGAQRTGSDQVL